MIRQLIDRYKQHRTMSQLRQENRQGYAFVGMGQHSLTNLYTTLNYLNVPLKYICVTREEKARAIGKRYPGVTATTSLSQVLADDSVKGVIVAASPAAHPGIASQVIASGRNLLIEKPPCLSGRELEQLIALQQQSGATVVAGLQKRYAPCVQILKKRLAGDKPVSYTMRYATGQYPEGNALTDLYIHAIDLAVFLMGHARIVACEKTAAQSCMLMLKHGDTTGFIELSTAYSWNDAGETLSICTHKGVYHMSQLEQLVFTPRQQSLCGIPLEKVMPRNKTVEYLYCRNNFVPIPANNQIYSQGFYDECKTFADITEGRKACNLTPPESLRDTFELLDAIAEKL